MRFCNLKAFGRIEGILPACFIRDVNTPALIKEILCSLRRRARLKAERLHKMSIPERVNGEGHYCLRKTVGAKPITIGNLAQQNSVLQRSKPHVAASQQIFTWCASLFGPYRRTARKAPDKFFGPAGTAV
jgi:hypothetical protein